MTENLDKDVVDGFGDEWTRFDQSELTTDELARMFDNYFSIFPWNVLPADAVGFDLVDKQGVGRGGQDIDGGEHQQDLGLHAPFFAVFHLPFPCVGGHADAHAGWEV